MPSLRTIFSSKKPEPFFPPDWPSPLHHKCNQPGCWFPNPPQVAKGVYDCQGVPGGFYCEGTYKVSSTAAELTERYFQEEFRIDAANKRRQRLMEKRRYDEDHYTHAHHCHHDDHPKVKMAMNLNSRYDDPKRRQRVASEAATPLSKSEKIKHDAKESSQRKRVASETAPSPASLQRSRAQRRNPSQECAVPGVREYYQHHTPSKQPPSPPLSTASRLAMSYTAGSDRRPLQSTRSAYPLRPTHVGNTAASSTAGTDHRPLQSTRSAYPLRPSNVGTTAALSTKPLPPPPPQARSVRSEHNLHQTRPNHPSAQSRSAHQHHLRMQ